MDSHIRSPAPLTLRIVRNMPLNNLLSSHQLPSPPISLPVLLPPSLHNPTPAVKHSHPPELISNTPNKKLKLTFKFNSPTSLSLDTNSDGTLVNTQAHIPTTSHRSVEESMEGSIVPVLNSTIPIINNSPIEKDNCTPTASKKRAFKAIHWALVSNANLKRNYRLKNILGWGGCGAVVSADRISDDMDVAIKIIMKKSEYDTRLVETDIISSLNHANIIRYIDSFEDSKAFYIIMERFGKCWKPDSEHNRLNYFENPNEVDGDQLPHCNGNSASLFEFVDNQRHQKVPIRSQKPLFKQMAKAVAHLHSRKIVHGDIKEENILIGTKSGRLVAKLCDFGHSFKIFDSQPKMKLYGTKVVTSPELLLNSNKSDSEVQKYTGFAQDIWALGIVLYTMLHGNIPPENEQYVAGTIDLTAFQYYPTSYKAIDNSDCKDLLQRMLSINPNERITAQEILKHDWLK